MSEWLDIAIPLVASFEGCHRVKDGMVYPYLDTLAKPPVWTRGYGRTYGITENSPPITIAEAQAELGVGLVAYAKKVLQAAPQLADRPECLAATSSWAWNCGVGAFRASRLRRAIVEERWDDAVQLIAKPITAGGIIYRGLQRRRTAEQAIFSKGTK